MKRWLCLLLAALLLCGCNSNTPTPSDTTTTSTTTAAQELPSIYEPESVVETLTQGALRLYLPEGKVMQKLIPYAGGFLLVSGGENTRLTLLLGDKLEIAAQTALNLDLRAHLDSIRVDAEGNVAYYDPEGQDYVILTPELRESERIHLPGTPAGQVLMSQDMTKIYYCTMTDIRCLDRQTDITRVLKEQAAPYQSLVGVYFDGAALMVETMDSEGLVTNALISPQTGETYHNGIDFPAFETCGDDFFALWQEGSVLQLVYGQADAPAKALMPLAMGDIHPLLEMNGLAIGTQTENGCQLEYYDLETGLRLGCLVLPELENIQSVCTDSEAVWFTAVHTPRGKPVVCRWDVTLSPTGDETVYAGPWYTDENPDETGLAQCQARADEIGAKYGVEILLWNEAVKNLPGGYQFQPEHVVEAIQRDLTQLENALAVYPEGFLSTAARRAAGGKVKICLVRDIINEPLAGTPDVDGLQYWLGSACYVAVVMGESFTNSFHNALFHLIDTRVMNTCVLYDDWGALNPEGFSYALAYIPDSPMQDLTYLEGENRAFINSFSMSFPVEDRAAIMEYALRADGAEYFRNEIMQSKLKLLCQGIRKGFGYQKSEETFPWEQYLTESLAYKKN